MKAMWAATVLPALAAGRPDSATIRFRRIKCFGAGESAIEAMLPDLIRRGRDPLVGITAHEATITLRIVAHGTDEASCLAKIGPTERLIRDTLGDLVYGVEDEEIEDAALAALSLSGGTLATAEVGTRGQVAALFADAAARGPAACLRAGLVLPEVFGMGATAIAADIRQARGATHGLGIGPVRRSEGVESLEIALVGPEGVQVVEHRLGGAGTVKISRAAKTAVDLVRKSVQSGAAGRP